MPGRGSGIGLSTPGAGGLGAANVGGARTSTRSGSADTVYGGIQNGRGGGVQTHMWLWILVLLEIAALFGLRHAFRHYHAS